MAYGILELRVEPIIPALQGEFLTTEPQEVPKKPLNKKKVQGISVFFVCLFFFYKLIWIYSYLKTESLI